MLIQLIGCIELHCHGNQQTNLRETRLQKNCSHHQTANQREVSQERFQIITRMLFLQPNQTARKMVPQALASSGHRVMEIYLCSFGNSLEPPAALSYIEIDSEIDLFLRVITKSIVVITIYQYNALQLKVFYRQQGNIFKGLLLLIAFVFSFLFCILFNINRLISVILKASGA